MGWGEARGPSCSCEGCDRDTLSSLRAEVVRLRADLEAARDYARDAAIEQAEMLERWED